MANLSDLLTAAKNIVGAINAMTQNYLSVNGSVMYINITTATLIKTGQGRVATVVVITTGSAGSIYDSSTTTGVSSANKIFAISATEGAYVVNLPFSNGLVVSPGASMVVAVSYS